MKSTNFAAALVLFALVPVRAFAAEEAQPKDASRGVRVRVETTSGKRVEGILTSWEARTLTIVQPGEMEGQVEKSFVIDPATIARLDRSIGRKDKALQGAVLGAVIGLAAPALIVGGLAASERCEDCSFGFGALIGGYYFGRFTVPAGALIGAAIGHGMTTEVWKRVDHEGRKDLAASLGLQPAPGGAGARFTLSWK